MLVSFVYCSKCAIFKDSEMACNTKTDANIEGSTQNSALPENNLYNQLTINNY
jgi:hypothetical protein